MIPKDVVRKAVHDGIKEITRKESSFIRDDETFHDYGIDSLDRMNLLLEVEKRLHLELGDLDLEKVNTINLLEIAINEKIK